MRRKIIYVALMVWLAGAESTSAQSWEQKDWKTWSKSDCEKMLKDSPWTRHFVTTVYREGVQGRDSGTQGMHGEDRVELDYVVQLRSALPIRQAVIRLAMFENNYDQLPADAKKLFDERAQEYLTQSFENRIVVHVIYKTNLQELDRFLAQYWQQSEERVIRTTGDLIGPRGDRIRPVRFISQVGGAREFELIFPRNFHDEFLVNATDREFSVELPDVPIVILRNAGLTGTRQDLNAAGRGEQTTEPRVRIHFDVRKMQFQKKLEY